MKNKAMSGIEFRFPWSLTDKVVACLPKSSPVHSASWRCIRL